MTRRSTLSVRFRVFVATAIAVVSISAGFATAAQPAAAYPTEFDFNLLGWTNGSYGNFGQLGSTNFLTDSIVAILNYGNDLPWFTTTQETCWSLFDGDPNAQFHQLWARLAYISGNTMAYAFGFGPYDASRTHCTLFGDGVIARANSPTAKWGADVVVPLSPTGPDAHGRRIACVRNTYWILNMAGCTTHLATNASQAQGQWVNTNQAQDTFNGLATSAKSLGADFNLTPSQFTFSGATEATNGSETENSEYLTRKIDYLWWKGFQNKTPDLPAPSLPPWCNPSYDCTYLDGHKVSDHMLLIGFYFY